MINYTAGMSKENFNRIFTYSAGMIKENFNTIFIYSAGMIKENVNTIFFYIEKFFHISEVFIVFIRKPHIVLIFFRLVIFMFATFIIFKVLVE